MACSNSSDDEMRNMPGDFSQNCKRQVHNRVERRRKDKINSWIIQIGELLPDRDPKKQSKNSILERAAEYIKHLKTTNENLILEKCTEVQAEEFQRMKKQIADLVHQNDGYAKLLRAAGIPLHATPEELWDNKPGKYTQKFTAAQGSALSQQCENGTVINGTPKNRCFRNSIESLSEKERGSKFRPDSDNSQNGEKTGVQDSDGAESRCPYPGEPRGRRQEGETLQLHSSMSDSNEARNGFFTSTSESQDDSSDQKSSRQASSQVPENPNKVGGKIDMPQNGTFQGIKAVSSVALCSGASVSTSSQHINIHHTVGESTAVTHVLPSVPVMSSSQHVSSVASDSLRMQAVPIIQSEVQYVSSDPSSYLATRRSVVEPAPQPILFINENGVPVLQSASTQNSVTLVDTTPKTLSTPNASKQQMGLAEQNAGKNSSTSSQESITSTKIVSSSCSTLPSNAASSQSSTIAPTVDGNGGVVRPVNGVIATIGEHPLVSSANQAVVSNSSVHSTLANGRASTVQSGCLLPLNSPYVTHPTLNMQLPAAADTSMAQASSLTQPVLPNGSVYVGQPVTIGQQGQIITLGGNAVFNTPGNVAPQQHFPSALILPNGQIIPVVTQPSMMYAAPSAGMSSSFVLAPAARGQAGMHVQDVGIHSDFTLQANKQGPTTIAASSPPNTLLIPQATTMPSILPVHPQSVALGTAQPGHHPSNSVTVNIDGLAAVSTDGSTTATSVGNKSVANGSRIQYGNAQTPSIVSKNHTNTNSASQSGNSNTKLSTSKTQPKASKSSSGQSKRSQKSKPKNPRSSGSKSPASSQQVNTKNLEPEPQTISKAPCERTEQEASAPPSTSENHYGLTSYASSATTSTMHDARNNSDVLMNSCPETDNQANNCLNLEDECFGAMSKSFSGATDILAKATESIFASHTLEMSPPAMESLDDHLELSETPNMCPLPVNSENGSGGIQDQKAGASQEAQKADSQQMEPERKQDAADGNSSEQSSDLLSNLTNSLIGSSSQNASLSHTMIYPASTSAPPHSTSSVASTNSSTIMGSSLNETHSANLHQKNKSSPESDSEPSRKKAKKNSNNEMCNVLVDMPSQSGGSSHEGHSNGSGEKCGQAAEKNQNVFNTVDTLINSSTSISCHATETRGNFTHPPVQSIEEHSSSTTLGNNMCSQQTESIESMSNFTFPITEECSSLEKSSATRENSSYATNNNHASEQALQPLILTSEAPSPMNNSSTSSMPFLSLSPEENYGAGMPSKDSSHRQNTYGVLSMPCSENMKGNESQKTVISRNTPEGTSSSLETNKSLPEGNQTSLILTVNNSIASSIPMSSNAGTPSYCTTTATFPLVPSPSHSSCKKGNVSNKCPEISSKNANGNKGSNKECTRSNSLHNVTAESDSLVQKTSSQDIPHSPSLHFVSSTPPPPLVSKSMTSQEEHLSPSPLSPNFSSRSLPMLNLPKENSQYAMTGTPLHASHHQPCVSPFRYPPERSNVTSKSQSHMQMLPSPSQSGIPHSPGNRVSSASPHNIPSPGFSHRTTSSQNSLSLSSYSAEALIGHHTPASTATSNATTVSQNSNAVLTPPHSSQGPSLQSPYSSVPSSPSPRTSRAQISYSAESLIRSHSSQEKVKDSSSRVPGSVMPSAYITSSYQCQQRSDHTNGRVPILSTNPVNHCFPPRSENVQHGPSLVPSASVPHLNQTGVQPNFLSNSHMTNSGHSNATGNSSFTSHQNALHPPFGTSTSMTARHQLQSGIDHNSPCKQSVSSSSGTMNTSGSITSSYVNMTYSMESSSSSSNSLPHHHVRGGSESMAPTSLSSCLQNLPNNSVRSSASGSNNQQHAGCFFTGHSSSTVHSNSLMQISDPSFSLLSNQSSLSEQHRHDGTLNRPPMFGNFSQPNAQPHLVNNLFPGHFIPNGADVRNDSQVGALAQRSNQGVPMSNVHDAGKRTSSRGSQMRSPAPSSTKLPSPNKSRSGSKKNKQHLSSEEPNSSNIYSDSNRPPNSANYFSVPELSTSRNDNSSCYSTRYLTAPQRSLGTSPPTGHSVQHKAGHMGPSSADISSNPPYNPLFRPQTQNGLNLNFQPAGFGMNLHRVPTTSSTASVQIGTHTNSASSHHMPNFNLSNIFPDITATNESIGLSPVKFPPPPNHILTPPHPAPSVQSQPHADPSTLSHASPHQNRAPQTLYPGRPHHPPVIHNGVGFNTILGHNPHTFDSRSPAQMAVGINNSMAPPPPPFGPTHGHTPSFGNVIPSLNFSAHEH